MKFIILILLMLLIPLNDTMAEDHMLTLDKEEIKQYAFPFIGTPFINEYKLYYLIEDLNEKIYKDPINATFDEKGEMIQEKPGTELDENKFNTLFRKSFYAGDDMEIEVPKQPIQPRVDSELLAEISVQEMGSFVTTFKQSNVERTHNIGLASEAINDYVVFPGERFSFNEVVGERTEERGYKRAPVIVKGELAEDIGGGICQVSSTLYNAVDLKGIQIVERYAHSRSVPYVPPGRDATVSWWGPDFVFENMYNQPILVRAKADDGKMIVTIYSSDRVDYASDE